MKPTSLYKTLGMDKDTYSDAPENKYVSAEQPEHYYVRVSGRAQQDKMIDIMNLPSVIYDTLVKQRVYSQKDTIVRVNIMERLENKTKMKMTLSSTTIANANGSETISMYNFLGKIT